MHDAKPPTRPQRNPRGRFVKGVSGNPAGRPFGSLSRATQMAAALLDGEAEALMRREIELALAGDGRMLRHCVDRIIAPQRDQPVFVALPPEGDAAGIAGAMQAVIGAAAQGNITPEQAATLVQALESQARADSVSERTAARRLAAETPAIYNRLQLYGCAAIADGVREIRDEAGEVDRRVRELCVPILRLGEMARGVLAALPVPPNTVADDVAFLAARPVPPEHPSHPLAAEMGAAFQKLIAYLESNMKWLEAQIEERAAKRDAAGEADPIYRSPLFQPAQPSCNL